MGLIMGKWIICKRSSDQEHRGLPWVIYTPEGLEMYSFKTWSEAMAVTTVLTSMTTYVHFGYDNKPVFGGGYAPDLSGSAKLRVYHKLVRTSWVFNKNVVRRDKNVDDQVFL